MKNFEDDSKYNGVKKALHSLKKIEVPLNFEKNLFDRISQSEFEKGLSFIDKLFLPSRLLPSAGLAVAIVLIFFMTNIFISSNGENPLLANPRVRADVVTSNKLSAPTNVEKESKTNKNKDVFDLTEKEKMKLNDKSDTNNDPNLGIKITGRPSTSGTYYNGGVLTSVSPNGLINKRGLDYKQIYLQRLQKAQIEKMKKRIEAMLRNSER